LSTYPSEAKFFFHADSGAPIYRYIGWSNYRFNGGAATAPEAWILHGGVSLHLGPDAVGLCTEEAFLGVEPGDFPVGNPRIRRLQLALNLLPYRLQKGKKNARWKNWLFIKNGRKKYEQLF
jgi:hypothetical protein